MTDIQSVVTPGCFCGPCMLKKSIAFDATISKTVIDADRFILTAVDPNNKDRFITYRVDVKDGGVISKSETGTFEAAIGDHMRAVIREVGA